ncbi:ABC transporter permease [Kitasatospora sp. GP82]|uniref:ABC transporter permease n=1 Tax=Kitasatospora sp. GP82 TaxID=3035089 RepID=UPI002473A821|nr:ABC transporter permease [Kitasatospora sp. GP82]MDH6123593.1 ABC-2 type transport system permease protein [Kitasatospora sp. GP82]
MNSSLQKDHAQENQRAVDSEVPDGRLVQWMNVLGSEWIKIRSLRPVWTITMSGVLVAIGVTLLFCNTTVDKWDQRTLEQRAGFDPIAASFSGFSLLQLAMVVVGALAMSGEYSSGLIRMSFAAVPSRRPVVAAKAAVAGMTSFTIGVVTALTSFGIAQAMFATEHFGLSITSPGVLRAVLATGLHLASVTLISLSLAALIRHGAGSICVAFGLLFVLPPFLQSDHGWMLRVHQSLPSTALHRLTVAHLDSLAPSSTMAWASLVVYPIVLLAAAVLMVDRRDV